jgi:hypothetical protein
MLCWVYWEMTHKTAEFLGKASSDDGGCALCSGQMVSPMLTLFYRLFVGLMPLKNQQPIL